MDQYGRAKSRLFTELTAAEGTAVISIDDDFGKALLHHVRTHRRDVKVWSLSIDDPKADFHFTALSVESAGLSGTLKTPDGPVRINSPLLGRFNASNLAMAVGLCQAARLSNMAIEKGMQTAKVRGRLERVESDAPFDVVVDYAHSPDALAHVLNSLRGLCKGSIWCIFGCGGDRDATKRAPMGRAAAKADAVVVTNDNPRSEEPGTIAAEATKGAVECGFNVSSAPAVGHAWVELDRRRAIEGVLAVAQAGDLVLIAGKGHEAYQEIAGQRYPFDDAAVARDYLRRSI